MIKEPIIHHLIHTGAKQTNHNRNMGLSMVTVGLMGLWICLGSGVQPTLAQTATSGPGVPRNINTKPWSSGGVLEPELATVTLSFVGVQKSARFRKVERNFSQ